MAEGTLNPDTPGIAGILAKMALLPERGYTQASLMTTGYDDGVRLFKEDEVTMAFQGSWTAGQLLHGGCFAVGALIPPWNKRDEQAMPVLGSETDFTVCRILNRAAARRSSEFVIGKGFPILQGKRHNISPFQQDAETTAANLEVVDYMSTVSRYSAAASLYYSTLSSSTPESLHGLMQDILLEKVLPRQATKRLDELVKNEAEMHYK